MSLIVSTPRSELYDFDRLEDSLVALLGSQHLPSQGKRDTDTQTTPRVELQLTPGRNEGRRAIIQPNKPLSQLQAMDTWNFRLVASIITNRGEDHTEHRAIVGLVRYNLQDYRLAETLTGGVSPLHMITSIIEDEDDELTVPADNLDTTRLVFSGLFNIRPDAWTQF